MVNTFNQIHTVRHLKDVNLRILFEKIIFQNIFYNVHYCDYYIIKVISTMVPVRTYMELIRIYVELANPLTKHTLLVIWQIQDVFNTSRNKSSNLVLNPCKSIQETSKKMLFIKTQQIIYRDLMFNSRQFSTKAVSIKNYEIQISKSIFHAYLSYLCMVSFLTTLDIYKDYFKSRQI